MILIVFTRATPPDYRKQLDYARLDTLDEFWEWLNRQGEKLTYSLNKKKRTLTPSGWDKSGANPANLIQVIQGDPRMVTTIERIVSEDGILFENIKHCSESLVSLIALKCEISKTA